METCPDKYLSTHPRKSWALLDNSAVFIKVTEWNFSPLVQTELPTTSSETNGTQGIVIGINGPLEQLTAGGHQQIIAQKAISRVHIGPQG